MSLDHLYLDMDCEGERTLVGAAKLNQISLMVNFMLLESGGGGMRGRSFFRSSDSTPSSYRPDDNGDKPKQTECFS